MITKNQSVPNCPKYPSPLPNFVQKFAVVDWCYRKINPTYIYTECWPGAASGPWRPPYREAPL